MPRSSLRRHFATQQTSKRAQGHVLGACLVCRAVKRVDAKEQLAQTRQLRESTEQLRGGRLTRAGAAQVYVPEHVEPADGRQRFRVLFAV
jgi:hypothetical protein